MERYRRRAENGKIKRALWNPEKQNTTEYKDVQCSLLLPSPNSGEGLKDICKQLSLHADIAGFFGMAENMELSLLNSMDIVRIGEAEALVEMPADNEGQCYDNWLEEDVEVFCLLEKTPGTAFEEVESFFKENSASAELAKKMEKGRKIPPALLWPNKLAYAIEKKKVSAAIVIWSGDMHYLCETNRRSTEILEFEADGKQWKTVLLFMLLLLLLFFCYGIYFKMGR